MRPAPLILPALLAMAAPVLAQGAPEAEEAERLPEREREDNYQEALGLGIERLRKGDYGVAMRAFRFCSRLYPKRPSPYYNCACVRALEGKKGEALAYLEESLDRGFKALAQLERDEDLASLRADPRYKALVARQRERVLAGLKALHLPAGRKRGGTLVVFLHGDGQSPEDYVELFADRPDGVGFLLPYGGERRGRGWSFGAAAETRVLALIERRLKAGGYDAERVALAGFSIGAYRALNIALQNPKRLRGAIALSPFYDGRRMGPLLAAAARRGQRYFLTVGRSDSLRDTVRSGRDALVAAGVPVVFRRFDGGHRLPDNPRQLFAEGIAWVVDRRRPAPREPRGF